MRLGENIKGNKNEGRRVRVVPKYQTQRALKLRPGRVWGVGSPGKGLEFWVPQEGFWGVGSLRRGFWGVGSPLSLVGCAVPAPSCGKAGPVFG